MVVFRFPVGPKGPCSTAGQPLPSCLSLPLNRSGGPDPRRRSAIWGVAGRRGAHLTGATDAGGVASATFRETGRPSTKEIGAPTKRIQCPCGCALTIYLRPILVNERNIVMGGSNWRYRRNFGPLSIEIDGSGDREDCGPRGSRGGRGGGFFGEQHLRAGRPVRPNGPFGPDGPFGSRGPFGKDGPFGGGDGGDWNRTVRGASERGTARRGPDVRPGRTAPASPQAYRRRTAPWIRADQGDRGDDRG